MRKKKDRKTIRFKRRYKKFLSRYCNNCVSKNKNYCEDLELDIFKICFSRFYCSHRKCGWFVSKNKKEI